MKTILFFSIFIVAFNAISVEWKITILDRNTGQKIQKVIGKGDFFFPKNSNNSWVCALLEEEVTKNDQGGPAVRRMFGCANPSDELIAGAIVCDKQDLKASDTNEAQRLKPRPCEEELELKDLGGDVPNFKISIQYEGGK